MIDNYKLTVTGPNGIRGGTGDFDLAGFLMSMSGVPGFNMSQYAMNGSLY